MNKEEIKNILPHREPMLLLDEVEFVDDASVGKYRVIGDEFFLQGHFPGNPVVPGVILCEMMAQAACLLVNEDGGGYTPYFTGMKNVKFKNKVIPGDVLELKSEMIAKKSHFYFINASARVGDKLVASGELSFAIIKELQT